LSIKISQHISLDPLSLTHSAAILQQVNDSRTHLAKYLYWVDKVTDLASCQQYISQRINSGLPHAQWHAIIFKGEMVGVFAIKSVEEQGIAEVGYWLAKPATGYGIMSQIITSASAKLLRETPAKIIEFCCLEHNVASIKLATNLGAVFSHKLNDYTLYDGSVQAVKVYHKTL